MKMAEKMALRVLMVALLAVVGLVVLPGVSRAQSALQLVPIEGSSQSGNELRISNPTTFPLCANVYFWSPFGEPDGCFSIMVPPFGSMDECGPYGNVECPNPDIEDTIFIVSGVPDPNGNCSPWAAHPKAGLRSWEMLDDQGAVGISAQDAVLSPAVLSGLMRACYN